MTYLNIAQYIPSTLTEGPGNRFCIWLQGCHLHCSGCCNKPLQDFTVKSLMSVDAIFEHILSAKKDYNIEGVTFLGGEPLLQAMGLSILAKKCQEQHLSVICFTGFTHAEMITRPLKGVHKLLSYTDVLIDEPFIQELVCTKRNWVGSSNQNFIYLSSRYDSSIETSDIPNIEIHISQNQITINGDPHILDPRP